MKIATFNINNVKRRLPNLLEWLKAAGPDIVCLQELKAADADFPAGAIDHAGYRAVWRGEKTWNGVAILARDAKPVLTRSELPGDPSDTQARYIEAAVQGILIACLYLPNGNPQPGPKFTYKLAWFKRLIHHAAELHAAGVPVVLAGDYNVVPTGFDIYPTKSWDKDALLRPESRAAFRRLLEQGWTDAIRALHPDEPMYTFWHYLRNRWERDAGLRLDHLLLSPDLAARLADAGVDRDVRGKDNASDHAPAWIILRRKAKAPRAPKVDGSTAAGEPGSSSRGARRGEGAATAPRTPAKRTPASGRKESASPKKKPAAKRGAPRRPLLVIDGDSFAHRSYRALPKNHSTAGEEGRGRHRRFANLLLRLYAAERWRRPPIGTRNFPRIRVDGNLTKR